MADETRLSAAGSTDSVPNTDDSNDIDKSFDTQTWVTKKIKEISSRSAVWDHFDKVVMNGIGKARCRHCKNLYAANTIVNWTTGLRQHITLRCPVYKAKIETCTQKKINFASKDEPLWEFDQQLIRRDFVEMIITDELPFSFVEKEGFKKFMNVAQPLFQVPSRRTITRDCYELYGELRLDLKKNFRDAKSKTCLTTDTWTSLQRINYMCLIKPLY
ncbi:zinc finger BED domain-containing protein RICESLEEPER 3-like [Lycium ferocissimum]|uniref:zinc finger BED domain-containing protein RICESLEEPER 3-like n=1 Tax=Lycium ferocissimum TaxID=112874 RepID=UPI0028164CFD|nr:zinc finger BED domain-containing protein RICESLEEPER 3-like [Lycium ferocissimum]